MLSQSGEALLQIGDQIARIFKARQERRLEDAAALVRQASLEALGMEYSVLVTMDALSVAELLGRPERMEALARLLLAEAEVFEAQGSEGLAALRAIES